MTPFPKNSPIYRKPKSRVRLIAAVLIVALFLIGFVPRYLHSHTLAKETSQRAEAPPEVEVLQPKLEKGDPILLPATVQAVATTSIQARATGYVSRLYVDIGSKVRAGQLLAEVESPDTDQQAIQATADTARSRATVGQSVAQLARQGAAVHTAEANYASSNAKFAQAIAAEAQAKAQAARSQRVVAEQRAALTRARSQYQLAYTTVKRYETLLAQGFVAQQEYDQAAANFKAAAADVLSAEAAIASAQADVQAALQQVRAQGELAHAAKADADAARANIRAAQEDVNAGVEAVSANRAAVAASEANERRYAVLRGFEFGCCCRRR